MTGPHRPSGRTTVAGVIGSPVAHSLSPAVHNAAFAALGLDWVFTAFDVAPGRAPAAIAAMRALGLGGLSVTMPHKAAVLPALDEVSADARALGAVNCVARRGDAIVGTNTDGPGFIAALRAEGIEVTGRRVAVLGAGGAGRAVTLALAGAGADEVAVVNRTPSRAEAAVALAPAVARRAPVEVVADAAVVVNATSVGMSSAGGAEAPALPLPAELLATGQTVVDLVYEPLVTPLLAAAGDVGARAVSGVGMLVHQAALAFARWTGEEPPIRVMTEAASAVLAGRGPAKS